MTETVLVLVAVSALYWLLVLVEVRRLYSTPLTATAAVPASVLVLKPVRGLDDAATENLESFCRQDYPEMEVLFGVADPEDPVVPVVDDVASRCHKARVVVGSGPGTNPKAAVLEVLAKEASNSVIVVSDSDMRVGPDYLTAVVTALEDPKVGLVTCPYRGVEAGTLTARVEPARFHSLERPTQ